MTYKVIQWATGAMGKTCLQAVIDHPAMELAGLFVYSADKAGKDAGAIARREAVGVVATSNVDEILALDADVVIHCARISPPFGSHDAELVRLLESGKNVISINGLSDPGRWDSARRAVLAAACARGNSTLMGAGLNPGYAAEQLAVVATGACSRVDRVDITEYVDCRAVKHPDYVFGSLGFGSDPAKIDPNDGGWGPAALMNGMYAEVLSAQATRLGVELQRVETEHRVFGANGDLEIAAGLIPQGRVSHVNWRWAGHVNDQRRLTLSIHWFMETTHLPNPAPPLWEIDIIGQPCVRLNVEVEKHPEDESRVTAEQLGLAGAVTNAIPVICDAPAGLFMRPVATPYRADLGGWLQ
jgi:2,4-diaminopentanoate dehydrogenase